jgi:hypothetical protein
MRGWVAASDPGIGTSLSEYNLSIDSSQPGYAVTNALIQADTLGIFARQGLGLATRWALSNDGPLVNNAFLLYRNYDGHRSTFGDAYVHSLSADQGQVAVYGALRSSDHALTIVEINKASTAVVARLALTGFTPAGSAQVWQSRGGPIVAEPSLPATSSGFTATLPARSMTMFVLPSATGAARCTRQGPGGRGC